LLANVLWQGLLNALGSVLAWIYDIVPNYGIAIIVLTLAIRLLLLPLGIKQIKSMQHMQALQPKIKELQKKFKNNKQKQQEETMKLYKEAGVNPLGGCLPLLLTLPFLFAMYAVIRSPVLQANPTTDATPITAASIASENTAQYTLDHPTDLRAGDVVIISGMAPEEYNGEWTITAVPSATTFQADIGKTASPATTFGTAGEVSSYTVLNNHLPTDSSLFFSVVEHQNLQMLSVNLQCALATSGTQVVEKDSHKQPIVAGLPILSGEDQPIASNPTSQSTLDCGTNKIPDAIPYVALLLLMLGTAILQQRQMTKANPPAAQSGPNAAIMKYMPLMYGVWGFAFPAGLIVYWTTANAIQIGQQTLMLRAGHIGPEALERRMAEQRAKIAANEGKPQRKGIMAWMNEKAERAQQQRPAPTQQSGPRPKGGPAKGNAAKGNTAKRPARPNNSKQQPPRKTTKGAAPGNQLKPKKKQP
jgi:YidC/Oxa1 family membrane protein insertase